MTSQFNTPILFIIFNRPEITSKVFEVIKRLKPSNLYVAADGPRSNREGEASLCALTRKVVLENINWDCSVQTLFRDENLGCKKAVSSAISWFFSHEEQGIILEDDCLPNESFFNFCSLLLERYKSDNRIMHIAGTNFLNGEVSTTEESYFFGKMCHIWGWATWRRAWQLYDINLERLDTLAANFNEISENKKVKNNWLKTFRAVRENKVDTWDYQWVYSIWVNGGLCISPVVNLISNIGFGPDATHTHALDPSVANMKTEELTDIVHPETIERNKAADDYEMNALTKKEAFLKVQFKRVVRLFSPVSRH